MPDLCIMVIDDDPIFLEFMAIFLEVNGYLSALYRTTAGVNDQVLHEQPDLIILDIHIHEPFDGWHVFQSLRALPATVHIPVLLYSSNHTFLHSHRQEIRSMHGDVLEKPSSLDALLAKIEALMSA